MMTTPTLEIAAAVAEVPWSLLSTCSGLRLSHTGTRDCPQLRGQIPGNFESRLPTLTLASCVNVGRTSHHLSKPRFCTLAVVIPTVVLRTTEETFTLNTWGCLEWGCVQSIL